MKPLYLGIDIGTTKVSVAVASDDLSVHLAESCDHQATLPLQEGYFEQDFSRIEAAVAAALGRISAEILGRVASVGITCQMHSVLLGRNSGEVSSCVTWQDRRAENEVVQMRAKSGCDLYPGYGAVTLSYFSRRGLLEGWDWAGTPGDEMGRRLVGASSVRFIEPSLAAPWGIYDRLSRQWKSSAAEALGIPARFLPQIVPAGTEIGRTVGGFGGIPDGIPVFVAIGDNQASVLGSGGNPATDLFVTVGTGSQLSAVVSEDEASSVQLVPGLDLRPFPGNCVLVAVPPLSGGKAWSLAGDWLAGLLEQFGAAPPPEKELLDRLCDLAATASPDAGGLVIEPDFFGTRVTPGKFGVISGITATNFTLPNIARALAQGIVRNLFAPMPKEILATKKRLIGSGNGLGKCSAIRAAVQEACPLPLVMPKRREEAATGAALCHVVSLRS